MEEIELQYANNNMKILKKVISKFNLDKICSPIFLKNREYVVLKAPCAADYESGDNIFIDDDVVEFTLYFGFSHAHFSIAGEDDFQIEEAAIKVLDMVMQLINGVFYAFHCKTEYGMDFMGYTPAKSDDEIKKDFRQRSKNYRSFITDEPKEKQSAYVDVVTFGNAEIHRIALD